MSVAEDEADALARAIELLRSYGRGAEDVPVIDTLESMWAARNAAAIAQDLGEDMFERQGRVLGLRRPSSDASD